MTSKTTYPPLDDTDLARLATVALQGQVLYGRLLETPENKAMPVFLYPEAILSLVQEIRQARQVNQLVWSCPDHGSIDAFLPICTLCGKPLKVAQAP